MKKNYLKRLGLSFKQKMLYIFLFIPILIFAQDQSFQEYCATKDLTTQNSTDYTQSIDIEYLESFPRRSFDIYFWDVRKDDGTSNHEFEKEDYLNAIENINTIYSKFDICFNLRGYDTIRSDRFHRAGHGESGSLRQYVISNGKYKETAINVFLYNITNASGAYMNGLGDLSVGKSQFYREITPGMSGMYSNTLAHEIGHFFALIHTHSGYKSVNNCELVGRIPEEGEEKYNANTSGDLIVDTNAVPEFEREQYTYAINALLNAGYENEYAKSIMGNDTGYENYTGSGSIFSYNISIEEALLDYGFTQDEVDYLKENPPKVQAYIDTLNCEYIGIPRENSPMFKDCQGTPYTITSEDVRNVMGYTSRYCANFLSIGQGIRCHESIERAIRDQNEGSWENYLVNSLINYDLHIRNSEEDIGAEPDFTSDDPMWESPDIWVRNQDDGIANPVHQNPLYDGVTPNYVYVKVSNRGCNDYDGMDAGLWLTSKKRGSDSISPQINNLDQTGYFDNIVATDIVSSISAGDYKVLSFEWYPPSPQSLNPMPINEPNSWNFSLLARIHSISDPLHDKKAFNFVYNNNNIAAKNVKIVGSTVRSRDFKAEATKILSASKKTYVLKAKEVDEPALYNWYDENGNLAFIGQEFHLPINHTNKYKLEVVAKLDNYKDYDEIDINSAYGITSLSPNPAESEVVVTYYLPNNIGNNTYIGITSISGTNMKKYSANKNSTTLDLTTFTTGSYVVSLFYKNEIIDSKMLIIK